MILQQSLLHVTHGKKKKPFAYYKKIGMKKFIQSLEIKEMIKFQEKNVKILKKFSLKILKKFFKNTIDI